jgi:hypothetical protein
MRLSYLSARLAQRLGRAPQRSTAVASAAILAGGMMFTGAADAGTLLSEGFEGVTLGPFVSRTTGSDGTDFSEALPTGWVRDTTTTPAPATGPEYFGPQVFDVDSWVAEAGQARDQFTKGGVGAHGNVVVFDADQFDDQTGIEPDLFNVYLRTPSLSLAGVAANKVTVRFDSSFRPYDGMTGLVDVSFNNGGTWTNLLTLDTASSGGNSSLSRVNESIALPVSNPAGGSMLVRFGMVTAGNDWWWAIDNVRVSTTEADVNGDGSVDIADFDIIRQNFYEGTTLAEGDVDGDGSVTEADFRIWKNEFGGGGPNSVPEPSSWALLLGASLGAVAFLRRRGR